MKKNLLFTAIVLAVVLLSCNSRQSIETDELIAELFTKEEIQGLRLMINYTDSVVSCVNPNANIAMAYHEYLDMQIQMLEANGDLIAISDLEKYHFLESINKSAFDAVFNMLNDARRIKYKDTIVTNLTNFKQLTLSPNGKYSKYLIRLGEHDDFFKSFSSNLTAMGCMSASQFNWFIHNHKNFDFSEVKNRLFVSIFILRIEESYNKKIERYMKMKEYTPPASEDLSSVLVRIY
ncbi:hypothetical protein [Carboxylicivirga sp. M1479]|uniref:hypothetical protein n=1 Tax=Carboxylicivirga sp. M1479 TaxID=2594476 RepID=UPI00117837CB|nr:hypothetical protein [Carboxylicivirga sp. M1479]TRX71016.1 hypothetical protein FNN09_08370 [Carboxylicivirga sp. M1479]